MTAIDPVAAMSPVGLLGWKLLHRKTDENFSPLSNRSRFRNVLILQQLIERMSFESFKIFYLSISMIGATGAFLLLRKSKDDLSVLFLMSLTLAVFLAAYYFDVKKGNIHSDQMMGYLLHGLIHNGTDGFFTLCDATLWGTAAFAVGIKLNRMKEGKRAVWLFFIILALLKTFFDGFVLGLEYPATHIHSSEWGIVLFDWLMIYLMAALFITKGIEALTDKRNHEKSND